MSRPVPGPGSAIRLPAYTPSVSRNPSITPRLPKTPLTRRLIASTRVDGESPETQEHSYKDLLLKTWKIHSLSPLFKFKSSKTCLTKYGRSLDVALSEGKYKGFLEDSCGHEKSLFSIYEGLNINDKDAEAIHIQVVTKPESDKRAKVVLNAFLVCVDLDSGPVPADLTSHFTYYPVILISSSKSRGDILLTWLEQHFDCDSSPVLFSDNDLRWMLASWNCCEASKTFPVLLQYSLSDICDGISTIDCKFDAAFCKELWERLNGEAATRQAISELEVNQFVNALEEHLEYTMQIIFSKLNLSEIGTSVAYVSSQGKLKLFSHSGVSSALNLICQIVNDRLQTM